jgi:hypothetical protein
MIYAVEITGSFLESQGNLEEPSAMYTQFDGPYRTNAGATPAKGAFFFAPKNLPGQILDS